MGLSRLDNFLKSTRGEILYVDPSCIDSTDSIENKGNSLARPFKTLQRALIEAVRFSPAYEANGNDAVSSVGMSIRANAIDGCS